MNNQGLLELSREKLAQLAREYMLAAQFNSRTGYAALGINHGEAAYKEVAIDNWIAASPVYTARMQQAMGLRGESDVETILKGMQLECGLSHQYFDAHFERVGPEEGYFWLRSCGPLLETEPRGEAAVRVMCHDIEDPTFDATAVASNPRARVRPVHRPPRVPADRVPHCRWQVVIQPDAEPIAQADVTRRMRRTRLAGITVERPVAREQGGLDFYDCPLFEQLQLERFSQAALTVICKELAIQIHLLVNSLGMVVADRFGETAARAVSEFQMAGSCWVISERLKAWLGCESGGLDAIVDVLRIHPALQPAEYIGMELERPDADRVRLTVTDCPALHEAMPAGWCGLLREDCVAGLEGLVRGVDPRARIAPVQGESRCWEITLDGTGESVPEPLGVQLARGTVLYRTKLENHLQLLHIPV